MKLNTLLELDKVKDYIRNYVWATGLVEVETGIFDVTHGGFILKDNAPDLPFKLRNVHGTFDASNTNFSNLENGPREVFGDYHIYNCKYTSLKGLPSKINGDMDVSYNFKMPMLRLLLVKGVKYFRIESFNDDFQGVKLRIILEKHYKNGDRSAIVPCQDELIEAGFEWAAKL